MWCGLSNYISDNTRDNKTWGGEEVSNLSFKALIWGKIGGGGGLQVVTRKGTQ